MVTWPSPAKINLFLHVVGKRDDGYHLLQTIFQFLDYGDELTFELNDTGRISREYDYGFSEDSDLCLRAAFLLKKHAAPSNGVAIGMHKKLPMGGGLGGGSSNAATVLLALNHLWDCGLSREELAQLALQLGADVPVFVAGYAAWAEGVGEVLSPIQLPEPWYLVLWPQVSVSTARIFSNKNLTATVEMKKIRALESRADMFLGQNQLQAIAIAEYSEVGELLDWMNQFAPSRMTGSGGAVFLAVDSFEEAEEIMNRKPEKYQGFIARGLNKHPLADQTL